MNAWQFGLLMGSFFLVVLQQEVCSQSFSFTTLAGQGSLGDSDGPEGGARFNTPNGVAVDSLGNIYVADSDNHTIRKIAATGVVSTFAGMAGTFGYRDGVGTNTLFRFPNGIAVDSTGNLYIADSGNDVIRTITPAGVVSTLAGMAANPGSVDDVGTNAQFNFPTGVAVDAAADVFVADNGNHTIRMIDPSGQVTTLAGQAGNPGSADGAGTDAQFQLPYGVAVDTNGSVYVTDSDNQTIRKITASGQVSTFAGLAGSIGYTNATASAARFNFPRGVALDGSGNLYVADSGNNAIRMITPAQKVSTWAGVTASSGESDGPLSTASLNQPYGVATDHGGNVYVADTQNNSIREVTYSSDVITVAGLSGNVASRDGTGRHARFSQPFDVAVDVFQNVYVADSGNYTIRKIAPGGISTTFAGRTGVIGSADGQGTNALFGFPTALVTDLGGNVFVADYGNNTIRKITPAGYVTTLAGSAGNPGSTDGVGTNAQFNRPFGVGLDIGSELLYVTDSGNCTIRTVTMDGLVSTIAGQTGNPGSNDGVGTNAQFNFATGIAADMDNQVFVADTGNSTIRVISRDIQGELVISTLAGQPGNFGSTDGFGTNALFNLPVGVGVRPPFGDVYIADKGNNTIRKLGFDGLVSTISGLPGSAGNADGTGSRARFNSPEGIAMDQNYNLYVADTLNNTIRIGNAENLTRSLRVSIAGNAVVLSWPLSAQEFVLQSSPTVSPSAVWTTLTNSIGTVGNEFTLTNTANTPAAFYRLYKPDD
jgi:sugar lactone lactonase YvrE